MADSGVGALRSPNVKVPEETGTKFRFGFPLRILSSGMVTPAASSPAVPIKGDGTVGARTRRSSRRLAMPHPRDFRDVYRRQAEACLAVLTTTTNPTSQAMLTAMAHTWMRLADSRLITDGGNAEQYRRNAYEACQSMTNAEPQDQALWLRLADCWLGLLGGDENPHRPHSASRQWLARAPEDSQSWQ